MVPVCVTCSLADAARALQSEEQLAKSLKTEKDTLTSRMKQAFEELQVNPLKLFHAMIPGDSSLAYYEYSVLHLWIAMSLWV